MHIHGMNMFVLASGTGNYSEETTVLNLDNPMRRDVQMVVAKGFIVVQLDGSRNPGAWPFHCHVTWHASTGFFSQMLFRPDALEKPAFTIPHDVRQTCKDWERFTKDTVVDQIDSGL